MARSQGIGLWMAGLALLTLALGGCSTGSSGSEVLVFTHGAPAGIPLNEVEVETEKVKKPPADALSQLNGYEGTILCRQAEAGEVVTKSLLVEPSLVVGLPEGSSVPSCPKR